MAKTSTTQKVLNAMRIYLSKEENQGGVGSKELWKYLESVPAIKREIYGVNGRRDNILTGITNRIKAGQISDVKVKKINKHLVYYKSINE